MLRCTKCQEVVPDDTKVCAFCKNEEFVPVTAADTSSAHASSPPPREPNPANADTGGQAGGGSTARFIDRLREVAEIDPKTAWRQRRPLVLLMIGHSSAGKSWFIARAKYEAPRDLQYHVCSPDLPERGKDGKLEGHPIGRTEGLQLHSFRGRAGRLVIVDIAGEVFEAACATHFTGNDAVFLEAIAHADGFAFVAPALEVLNPEAIDPRDPLFQNGDGPRKRVKQLLDNIDRVGSFARFMEKQRRSGLRAEWIIKEFAKLSEAQQSKIVNSSSRTRRPAYLLLSKTDKLQSLHASSTDGSADDFDRDPFAALAKVDSNAKALIDAIRSGFKRFRIDFATAAGGHVEFEGAQSASQRITQNVKFRPESTAEYGVVAAVRWLRARMRASRNVLGRVDPGSGFAVVARRLLDAEFHRDLGPRQRRPRRAG